MKSTTKKLAIVFLSMVMVFSLFSIGFRANAADFELTDNVLSADTRTIAFKNSGDYRARFSITYFGKEWWETFKISTGELSKGQSAQIKIPSSAWGVQMRAEYFENSNKSWNLFATRNLSIIRSDFSFTSCGGNGCRYIL